MSVLYRYYVLRAIWKNNRWPVSFPDADKMFKTMSNGGFRHQQCSNSEFHYYRRS